MKKIILLTLLLVCSSFALAVGPQDFPANLISYWKADGNVNDSADSNHGTLQGDTTYNTGIDGQAFSFDGDGDWIHIPHNSNMNIGSSTDVTFAAWVKTTAPGIILMKSQGTTYYRFNVAGSGKLYTALRQTGYFFSVISDAVIMDGEWHHLAAVVDRDVGMKLYIDGVLNGSNTNVTNIINVDNPGEADISKWVDDPSAYINGSVDDLAIWNRTLSDSEILDLYNSYESGTIPEVGNRSLQIFVILIVALLIGALFLRKN